MNNFFSSITQLFKPAKPIPAGVYHFQSPTTADNQYRLHLRVSPNGEGLLIINASTILHLNQSATEYAYHLIKETIPDEVARLMTSSYEINRNDARSDFFELKKRIRTLLETRDLEAAAPYRLDCAITYQLPEKSHLDLAPVKRVDRELTTEEWEKIINRSWRAGIPHLIFTGGEPTIREDLIDLIICAEKNGQVTGLLTDGYKLINDSFRNELLQSGLDHLLFILTPTDKTSWDALRSILSL